MKFWRAVALFLLTAMLVSGASAANNNRIDLHHGWHIESSAKVKQTGAEISKVGYSTAGWHAATVPTTVVAALVADHTFPDPYFGKNFRDLPGVAYPIGENFSLLDMPQDSPFNVPWWYRSEFTLPAVPVGKKVSLHLDGISFRANVWLNGKQIGKAEDVAGTWRLFEL